MTLIEVLSQLVNRCEHAHILQFNEGMRGPLLAEAKADAFLAGFFIGLRLAKVRAIEAIEERL